MNVIRSASMLPDAAAVYARGRCDSGQSLERRGEAGDEIALLRSEARSIALHPFAQNEAPPESTGGSGALTALAMDLGAAYFPRGSSMP
jgi:hypothetical protein